MKAAALLAVAVTAQIVQNGDFIEPSIANEIDHALSLAAAAKRETPPPDFDAAAFCATNSAFGTNGFNATDRAIRIVSAQRSDGRWLAGTNDVTSAVSAILEDLLTLEIP